MTQQMFLTLTIETDGRQADANQHMVLTHIIETDGRRPHNRNRWQTGRRHAWPILLFALQDPFIPLLTGNQKKCRREYSETYKIWEKTKAHFYGQKSCLLIDKHY